MLHHHQPHVRLARLLLDSILDIVYNIGIPFTISYSYYYNFSDSQLASITLTDTWYITMVSELRQVLVTSWLDLISKSTGLIALLYRIYVLEEALTAAQDPLKGQGGRNVRASRMTKSLDGVLLVWGLVVLILHIHSTIVALHGEHTGCLLEIRPWGSSTYSCAVLEVSCVQRQTMGDYPTIVDALDNVNLLALQVLIFSHCAQLYVPSIVQTFAALTMFKVYNTTIYKWNEHAAFHETTNPMLHVLYFIRVNMSTIPAGLRAPDFPPTVGDIEFCITNLTTVPMEVIPSWQHSSILHFKPALL